MEHEKVHSEYSFPCPKCSKTFHTNDALKHHLPLHEVFKVHENHTVLFSSVLPIKLFSKRLSHTGVCTIPTVGSLQGAVKRRASVVRVVVVTILSSVVWWLWW